jgi:gamma-glutamylcyclotransferase (GGCT)/AIG2-like uncharacterized protein YtfP
MEYTKYFAYGMNTNIGQMASRCPQAVDLGAAVLPNYEFRFARVGDVLENPEFNCQGVLWDLTPECLKALDRLEGYPWMYQRKFVTVQHNGESVDALVYYMVGDNEDEYPSQHYYDMLMEGYTEHGLDTSQITDAVKYIEYLEAHQVAQEPNQGYNQSYDDHMINDPDAWGPHVPYDDVEDIDYNDLPNDDKRKQ